MASAEAVLAVIDAAGAHVPELMDRLETRLQELATSHGDTLAGPASATISAGGKRLRPLLVLLAAGPPADEAEAERLLRAAVAVELVHSATLVHDDVLDAAPLRRGRPTVFAASGRLMATAVGDLLFAQAFAELASGDDVGDVQVLSDAASALAAGELMQRADAWDTAITRERYLERCDLKTARLFEAACRLGARENVETLAAFGRRIGLAFQLLDDVLDVSGPAERTGKHRGTDLLDGTVTLPFILAGIDARPSRGPDARAGRGAVRPRSRRPAPSKRHAARPWRWSMRRRRRCRRCPRGRAGRLNSWPTASSTATRDVAQRPKAG